MEQLWRRCIACLAHPLTITTTTQLLAELINAKSQGVDAAQMVVLFSRDRGNDWINNPFMYLIWMAWLGNGGFGFGNSGNAQTDILAKLNSMQGQITDNNNNAVALDAIRGNTNAIHELATNLNANYNDISQAVASVRNAITEIGGQIGYSSERVINAIGQGNLNLIQQLKDCCCQTQQSITRMGYESQLGQKDLLNAMSQQTLQLGERFTGIANGIQQGFSASAYETQRNAAQIIQQGERIIQAGNQNTQRIVDVLAQHWTAEQSQELQNAKFEISQMKQNETIAKMLSQGTDGGSCRYGTM